MKPAARSKLWHCPKCGRRFAHANQWHSCAVQKLDYWFGKDDAKLKSIYDRLLVTVRKIGPVTVVPQKGKIALYARVTFAGVRVRKKGLFVELLLSRRRSPADLQRLAAPCVKVFTYLPRRHAHSFHLTDKRQLDAGFRSLLTEAYAIGAQLDRTAASK